MSHRLMSTTNVKIASKNERTMSRDGDIMEIDHIQPRSQGGTDQLDNKCVLHRHCHDVRHAKDSTQGINNK